MSNSLLSTDVYNSGIKGIKMAFRIVRQRKEARRNAKLEEIFQDRDKTQKGSISHEQLVEIFRIYEVKIDEGRAAKLKDEDGNVSKADFLQFAKDCHLLDFDSVLGEVAMLLSPRRSKKNTKKDKRPGPPTPGDTKGLWAYGSKGGGVPQPGIDKVEVAFRRFDLDRDGFLSWKEFKQFGKNMDPDQARRIFSSCDQDRDGRISLVEFRRMVEQKPAGTLPPGQEEQEGVEPEKEKEGGGRQ